MAVSALLKSAAATRAKIQTANDNEIAFEWSVSPQTYDDYLSYSAYLKDAASKSTDPSTQLSYATKNKEAFRGFTSNEIQRQTQAVSEGNATIQDKMKTVEQLYNQAVANGDENLAQNLVSNWDALSTQAQNDAKAASGQYGTDLKNQVADTVDGLNGALGSFVQAFSQASTPQEQQTSVAKINAQLPANLQIPEGTGLFDAAASYSQAIIDTYKQAVQLAPDAATADALTKASTKYAEGTVLSLPGMNGKSVNLSLEDVQKQIAASNIGQTMFSVVPTAEGNAYVANKVDNMQFGHDANGNVVAVPTYSLAGKDLSAGVTDLAGNQIKVKGTDGKKAQANYKQLLQAAGFNVTGGENGSFTIEDSTGKNRLNGNSFAQVYLDNNGALQFSNNDNQIFNIGFNDKGEFSGVSKQTANPFLDATKGTDIPYFQAHQDQFAQAQGTAGLLTPQTLAQFSKDVGINTNPTLSGGGLRPNTLASTSATNVIQGAANIQQANANSVQAHQIATAPVPQLQAPNISQNILNSRPSASVTVAPVTAPAATISTKPQSTGNFTGVSTAKPNFNISF